MIITIITATEKGGAGAACKNLYKGLLSIGVEAYLLTVDGLEQEKLYPIARILRWWNVRKNINRNFKSMKGAPSGYDHFSIARTGYINLHKHPFVLKANVINVHWISNMVDYKSFFTNIDKPIVWTLHDTNPFTGGCHYTYQCDNFMRDCSNCIQLGENFSSYVAKENLQLKRDSLKLLNPQKTIVISPSKWLQSLSQKSSLFKQYAHFNVPYGIDTDIFRKHALKQSREKFNLPLDKFIVLFVATNITETRKGFDVILKIEEIFSGNKNVLFVAIGNVGTEHDSITNLGYISDKESIAKAYSAANVFLIPSREDNLPNTMLESLCCGTPVIGYKTGGIVDTIENGKNGYLIEHEDISDMVNKINSMIDNPKLFDNKSISDVSRQKYSLKKQAETYLNIIKKLFV